MARRTRSRTALLPVAVPLTGASLLCLLLVTGIGLLFVGCSRIHGPSNREELGFTEEDYAAMQNSSTASSDALPPENLASDASASEAPVVDLSWMPIYDAIRAPGGAENEYIVNNDFVNVRDAASQRSTLGDRLERGTHVLVTEFPSAAWAKVTYGGKNGFIASRYLGKLTTEERLANDKKAFDGKYFVDYQFVNIRREPSQGSEKIGEIPKDVIVMPTSLSDSWAGVSYNGVTGYVSTQYLSPFLPSFVVRQETFLLPIVIFNAADPAIIAKLPEYLSALRSTQHKLMSLKDFADLLISQQERDVRLAPNSVAIGITGITGANVKAVSDALTADGGSATLFLASKDIGLSGITEKTVLTLLANGFDLQSAADTGVDLRTLNDTQLTHELRISRQTIEDLTNQPVRSILYPAGGVNDRIASAAKSAGYLLGIGNAAPAAFGRKDLLMLPSLTVLGTMTPDQLAASVGSNS